MKQRKRVRIGNEDRGSGNGKENRGMGMKIEEWE